MGDALADRIAPASFAASKRHLSRLRAADPLKARAALVKSPLFLLDLPASVSASGAECTRCIILSTFGHYQRPDRSATQWLSPLIISQEVAFLNQTA